MDALTAARLCALFVAAPVVTAPCTPPAAQNCTHAAAIQRWQPLIADAARRFDIPQAWICVVMRRESGGRITLDGKPLISRAGAMGLMQLMPSTYADMRRRYGFGPDPYEPRDNILAGAAYLHEMFARYGYPALFAAYQAGPARLDAVLAGVEPLPASTKIYLQFILADLGSPSSPRGNSALDHTRPSSDSLFFVRNPTQNSPSAISNPASGITNSPPGNSALFVPLDTAVPQPGR